MTVRETLVTTGNLVAGIVAFVALMTALALDSTRATASTVFGPAVPVAAVNSSADDGCPIESPDGRSLYLASTRAGTLGGNDMWVSHRSNTSQPWSTPEQLTTPVNATADDFCPTPLTGKRLLFLSERPAPNFDGPEFSPSLVTTDAGTWLFFSGTGDDGTMDLYVSRRGPDGSFGPPVRIDELSTAADDRMPNVSRDGLEMVFVSTRTDLPGARGAHDVYLSQREHVDAPWGTPVNLGPQVNSPEDESRPSLSGDGERLYFGRRGDILMSLRAG